jgi:hypothetical protein
MIFSGGVAHSFKYMLADCKIYISIFDLKVDGINRMKELEEENNSFSGSWRT